MANLDREATDEVMNSYRSMLDKINDGRDKTDNQIAHIKESMSNIDKDASYLEAIVRSKT